MTISWFNNKQMEPKDSSLSMVWGDDISISDIGSAAVSASLSPEGHKSSGTSLSKLSSENMVQFVIDDDSIFCMGLMY